MYDEYACVVGGMWFSNDAAVPVEDGAVAIVPPALIGRYALCAGSEYGDELGPVS